MKQKGFSLIELIVATAIFATVVGAAVGIFVSSLKAQARMLAYQQLLDSSSYTMEYMSRILRMAKKDDVGTGGINCLAGTKVNYEEILGGIRFRDYNDKCHEFYLDSNNYLREKIEDGGSLVYDLPITPNELTITDFKVIVEGEEQAVEGVREDLQPRVTLGVSAQLKNSGQPKITIQTTISQRNLDVEN